MRKVLLLSDSHGYIDQRILKYVDEVDEVWHAGDIGHIKVSQSILKLKPLKAVYGNIDDIRNNFDRIMNLDPKSSDNIGRVTNIKDFASNHFNKTEKIRILDIGSGLGVFLAQIKLQTDWNCKAIEPDPQMALHLSNDLKIKTYNDDLRKLDLDERFDIITLNKVLEHILDPMEVLASCNRYLENEGFVYIEVPDGQCAAEDRLGYGREEFFLEHHHVFSRNSTRKMVEKAGFELIKIETIKEPSTKYTIRAFLQKIS